MAQSIIILWLPRQFSTEEPEEAQRLWPFIGIVFLHFVYPTKRDVKLPQNYNLVLRKNGIQPCNKSTADDFKINLRK